MLSLSRREFLAMAAVGGLSGPEWRRYSDPATDLEVIRLTDPASACGMSAPQLTSFSRDSNSLLYWSERTGSPQAFLLNLKLGTSQQMTDAEALDRTSLALAGNERSFFFFDGPVLMESPLPAGRPSVVYRVAEEGTRKGFSITSDGAVYFVERFVERQSGRSRIVRVMDRKARRIVEVDGEINDLMARPRHSQVLYRAGGTLWMMNGGGSGRRQLRTEAGQIGEVRWIPSGRTFIYLHNPEDPKELITLREHTPETGTDRVVARTSQLISASANGDASVFAAASGSRGSPYVLILLRVTRREMPLCEHRASDARMAQPVFSPDSKSIVFVSDRDGKSAVYLVPVAKFVEETAG